MDMASEALERSITEEGRRVIREALDLWQRQKEAERGMTMRGYHKAAQRTSNTITFDAKLENGLLGLAGEVGELCDLWKKHRYQGHKFDRMHMIRELGDVLWYVVETACGLDADLEFVAATNIDKLLARYPEGFDAGRSQHREEGDD